MLLQISYSIAYIGTKDFQEISISHRLMRDLSFLGLDGYSFYFWWGGVDKMMPTPGPQGAGTPVWWLTQCDLYGWVRTAAKVAIIPYICYGACRLCSTTIYAWESWNFYRATRGKFYVDLREELQRYLDDLKRVRLVGSTPRLLTKEKTAVERPEFKSYLRVPVSDMKNLGTTRNTLELDHSIRRRSRSLITLRSKKSLDSRSPSPISFNFSMHSAVEGVDIDSQGLPSKTYDQPDPTNPVSGLQDQGHKTSVPIPSFSELYAAEFYTLSLLPNTQPPPCSPMSMLTHPFRPCHPIILLFHNSVTTIHPLAWYQPPILVIRTTIRPYHSHPLPLHLFLITLFHRAHMQPPRLSKATRVLGPVLGLLVVSLLVIAAELTIQWNCIRGVQRLGNVGQLVPACVGIGGLVRVIWGCMKLAFGKEEAGWNGEVRRKDRDRTEKDNLLIQVAELYFRAKEETEMLGGEGGET